MPWQVTYDANPGKLQEMVNSTLNQALISHSSVLSNTVYNAVMQSFKEGHAPQYVGPAYHQPRSTSISPSAAPMASSTPVEPSTDVATPPRPSPNSVTKLHTDPVASAISEPAIQSQPAPAN